MNHRLKLGLAVLALAGFAALSWRALHRWPEAAPSTPAAAAPLRRLDESAKPAPVPSLTARLGRAVPRVPASSIIGAAWTAESEPACTAFRHWTDRFLRASPGDRTALQAEGLTLARARRTELARLIREDPQAALAVAVPMGIRRQLPAEITELLETWVSGSGSLALMAATPAPGEALDEPVYRAAVIGREQYRAYVYGRRLEQVQLRETSLIGVALDGRLALSESPVRMVEAAEIAARRSALPSAAAIPAGTAVSAAVEYDGELHWLATRESAASVEAQLKAKEDAQLMSRAETDYGVVGVRGRPYVAWTTGAKKVLLIRVDFSDLPGTPISDGAPVTPTVAVDLFNRTQGVRDFFTASSYGKTTLQVSAVAGGSSPDVTSVLRLPETADYYARGALDVVMHRDAEALARNAGYNVDGYDRVGVIFSNLGGIPNSQIQYGGAASVMDAKFFINGYYDFKTMAHELGHTYGLFHAAGWHPSDGNPVSSHGFVDEYGDPFEVMGSGTVFASSFSHWNRTMLGWLPDSAVTKVTSGGTYRVYRFDAGIGADLAKARALQLARDGLHSYWIGYRRGSGNASLNGGAYVVWGSPYNQAGQLLDLTTPGSDAQDAALPIGSTLNDTAAGISLTPVAQGGSGDDEWLDVQVTLQSKVQWTQGTFYVDKQTGNAVVTVSRTQSGAGALTVNYATAAGTASAPAHFAATSGSLTWNNGDTSDKTITIPLVASAAAPDPIGVTAISHAPIAGTRSFTVALSSPTGGVVGADPQATVTIKEAGSIDPTFTFDYIDSEVNKIVPLPDGGFLIGGHFNQITPGPVLVPLVTAAASPAYHGGVARLTARGELDESFGRAGGAEFGSNGSLSIRELVRQPDGKILVGGDFTRFNGASHNHLVRLMPDGSDDPSFNPGTGPNGDVYTMLVLPDGKIMVGGSFYQFNGTTSSGVVRLLPNGSLDSSFALTQATSVFPQSFALQADGKLLVAGGGHSTQAQVCVIRLLADGTNDPSFNLLAAQELNVAVKVIVQPDGKILVAGDHTTGYTGGVIRLNADGTRDTSFVPGKFDDWINDMALHSDGTVFVAGVFRQFEGAVANHVARLTSTGLLDPAFSAGGGFELHVFDVEIAANGRIVIAGPNAFCQDQYDLSPVRVLFPGAVAGAAPIAPRPPAILIQPSSQTVGIGANASFSIVASGSPTPTYQWSKNGTALTGETGPTLTLTNVQPAAAGTYFVVVTNSSGTVTSANVVLTVDGSATGQARLTSQPQDVTVNVGDSATFAVTASGNPPPIYAWSKNYTAIPGATSPSYTITNVQLSDAGDYNVFVQNGYGGESSRLAHLTVLSGTAPQFTQQPGSQTVTAGASVSFTVAVTGNPTPTIQWTKNGQPIAGATGLTLTLTNVQAAHAGSYAAIATNANGSVSSGTVTLSVQAATAAPAFTLQPVSQSAVSGATVTFTVAVSGSPAPSLQWSRNGTPISGATAATLTLSNVSGTDAASYTVVATNSAGSATSGAAVLTITPGSIAPSFTTQPSGRTVTIGESATFTVAVSGSPTPTIQWRKGGNPIAGATGLSLVLTNVQSADAASYSAVATNSAGSVASNSAVLTVMPPAVGAPAFTTQPLSQSALAGTSVTLTAAATGSPAPTLQWFKNGVLIPGATGTSLTLANLQASDAATYTVVATNSALAVTSTGAVLTVTVPAPPVISSQPHGHAMATGSTLVLSVDATGSVSVGTSARHSGFSATTASAADAPLSYQWYRNGAPIAGATAGQLRLTNLQPSDAGSYAVSITSPLGTVMSNPATVTVAAATDPGRIVNLSVRIVSGTGDQVLLMGFVVGGTGTSGSKQLLVRGVGPTLAGFGVPNVMADPLLEIIPQGLTAAVASNDNWAGNALVATLSAQTGAFALPDAASKDSALATTLAAGLYSAKVSGVGQTTGTVLAEIYDSTPLVYSATTPRLVNVSARAITRNDNPLIAGFVIGGTTAKTVLIRAVGPYLSQYFGTAALSDPKLDLYVRQSGTDSLLLSNDNWGGSALAASTATAVGAFGLTDNASKDAVLLVTLDPGIYSAKVTGVGDASGIALIEVYEVP